MVEEGMEEKKRGGFEQRYNDDGDGGVDVG